MENIDVLIVGAGPAGATCAERLRAGGLNTLIVDKATFPRVKPCGGWITPQLVEDLQLDVEEYRRGRTWQPLSGFHCGLIGGGETLVRYSSPVSYGIRRLEFDTYLLDRSGSETRLGESVSKLERAGREWIVNGSYRAPLLVGAGRGYVRQIRQRG